MISFAEIVFSDNNNNGHNNSGSGGGGGEGGGAEGGREADGWLLGVSPVSLDRFVAMGAAQVCLTVATPGRRG